MNLRLREPLGLENSTLWDKLKSYFFLCHWSNDGFLAVRFFVRFAFYEIDLCIVVQGRDEC